MCFDWKLTLTTAVYTIKDITEVIRLSPLIKFVRLLERPTYVKEEKISSIFKNIIALACRRIFFIMDLCHLNYCHVKKNSKFNYLSAASLYHHNEILT